MQPAINAIAATPAQASTRPAAIVRIRLAVTGPEAMMMKANGNPDERA
jgi:hypothetical protein